VQLQQQNVLAYEESNESKPHSLRQNHPCSSKTQLFLRPSGDQSQLLQVREISLLLLESDKINQNNLALPLEL
jgi:hypothetical protein